MKQPAEHVTLSSEEGEVLIAHVRQSNLPAAVAVRLEEIVRTCLWLVFALQESKITLQRLRRLLFGKVLKGSASAPSPSDGGEPHAATPSPNDADESAATAGEGSPPPSQSPESSKPKGGHRLGTGRLGADA